MSKNINSFSQNVNQVISHSTNTLALLTAQQRALTENDTFVTFDYTDTNGNTIQYQLPSYDSVVNRLKAVEESINSLNNGRGSINLTDGSRRTITLSSIAHTPNQITDMEDPTTFQIDSNWFFESLMYPSAFVSIDLSGKIEDSADRVRVVRIILDARDVNTQTLWLNDLSVNKYDYISLRTLLSNNGISYYEDEDTIDLPLKSNTVSGAFQITEDPQTINGNIWYTLDSINYSTISVNGMNQGLNNILSVGDRLSYQESIFEIIEINQNNNKVRLKRVSGVQNPGVYGMLYYYTDPLASKSVNVHFGAHEYNIVYIKGIAEAYNLLADNWSTPIVFSTDELMLEGTSGLRETPFSTYYEQYIMDWGSQMIDEVKERRITAYKGSTPNTPVLNAADFRVVQINTQINAAIDTTDVKNTASEIESVKSQISSLKSTIAAQKSDLQSAVNAYTYNSIQEQIATNTKDLQNLQTTYTTLVKSFQTTVKENAAITTEPKYHIRGFFPIPTLKFLDEAQTIAEEIIGFDIAYRYITEDNTSTQLNTFTYTDTDGQTEITGTFTDWVVERGPMKTRVFDEEMQRYVWRAENVADGTETNINQIDIAISRGEKVEIKVRAISEAGYSTNNPLLSPWSNVITMEFPSTLASTNEIADLITEINDDAINIAINNNLEAIGVITHLSDTIPNTNSVNGMYYVHTAKNIAYEEHGQNANGTSVVNSISVQDKIDSLYEEYKNTNNIVSNNVKEITQIKETMTERHQVYEAEFVDISTHLGELDASAVDIQEKFDSIVNEDGYLYTKKLLFNNDDNTTKVVLSTLNRSQLFVLDGTQTDDDILTIVHAHDYVYYPSTHTVGENDGMRVSTKFEGHDLHFVSVDNSVNIINASVNAIEDFNKTVALRSDLLDVSKVAADVRDTVNGFYMKNGDSTEITATHVFLGKRQTGLSSGDMSGSLYVLTGQSDTQLGIVHVDDVAMHNAGDANNTAVLMSDINQNVIVNTNSIQNLQLTVNEMNNLIERAIYIDNGNVQLRGETAVINDLVQTQKLLTNEILMEGGKAMYVRNEVNSAMLTDVHSKAFIVHTDGTDSGDTVNIYKYINDVSAVVTRHDSFVEYAKNCIVADIVTDAAGSATQGFTCKVNNVTTSSLKTSYIDLNNSIRFATYSFNASTGVNTGSDVAASNQLFVLDINTDSNQPLNAGDMYLEKVHAHDFILHDGGKTSSPGVSMLQLYNDASILSKLVYQDSSSNDKKREFYIDTNRIQSREITVNATASKQAKCVITNTNISFYNDTSTNAIEYIQLDSNSGGLRFNGDLTTEHGNVNVLNGSINVNGNITCEKLLVKFNGGHVDIIEVFSQLLGIERTDSSTNASTGASGGTSGS